MTRIVNIGEALIDEITRPNSEPVEVVGGSMLNVAAGLTRLGHESELATWFARDARGDKVRAHAEAAGVTLTPGSDGAEFTTVAHAAVDEKGHATYEFDLTWDVPAVEDPDTVGHVHTGSYVVVVEPGADKVLAAVKRQAIRGTVSYDPNIRPALLGTPDEARPHIEAIVALADVVKASDEDLKWLYPDRPVEDVLREWSQSAGGHRGCWRLAHGRPDLRPGGCGSAGLGRGEAAPARGLVGSYPARHPPRHHHLGHHDPLPGRLLAHARGSQRDPGS